MASNFVICDFMNCFEPYPPTPLIRPPRQLPPTHHILMPRLRPILIHRHRLHDANLQVSIIPRNRAVRSNAHPLGHEFDVRLSIILARRSKARYYPMQSIAPIPPPIRPQQYKRRPKPIHHTPEHTELPVTLHLRQPYPTILGTTSDIKRIIITITTRYTHNKIVLFGDLVIWLFGCLVIWLVGWVLTVITSKT